MTEQNTEKIKIWRLRTAEWDRSQVEIEWLEVDRLTDSSYWMKGRLCKRVTNTTRVFLTFEEAHEHAMKRVIAAADEIHKQAIAIAGAVDSIKAIRPQDCKQSMLRW